jgi:glyoxylase-like metal-dependent hydrolase (beta-lactamase superfamily II)
VGENTEIILIEPPCGSNTAILKSAGEVLFIDSGYALYREEMETLFRTLLPEYDTMRKRIYVTHADVDHCGLLPLFDEIIAGVDTKQCFVLEYKGEGGYREQNPLHKPYVNICKAETLYRPPDPDKVVTPWDAPKNTDEPLTKIGIFDFGEMHFEVYQGKGGHLKGETVLIDDVHHIVFSGDIYINVRGLTKEQAEYNQYAPVLMTSVDTDPALCASERSAILQRLGCGDWQIFGAHRMKKEYSIPAVPTHPAG